MGSKEAIAMRELEKISISGVRYMIWDESRGICPDASGIKLLLSARDGVGADILLVLPKNRPLAVCAYANDGHKISVGEEALRAVSISLKRSTVPISETHLFPIENSVDYVEVRLTDSFFARLFDTAGRKSRLAG